MHEIQSGLEVKFMSGQIDQIETDGCEISGYASVFGQIDQSNDIVANGAFATGLAGLTTRGSKVKMLWQHDPAQPIGVWDEVYEDQHGLFVKGHILKEVPMGEQALSLLRAGAIDGLSIGYKTVSAQKDNLGRRVLKSVELWEVSLVTFPMLWSARAALAGTKQDQSSISKLIEDLRDIRRLVAK